MISTSCLSTSLFDRRSAVEVWFWSDRSWCEGASWASYKPCPRTSFFASKTAVKNKSSHLMGSDVNANDDGGNHDSLDSNFPLPSQVFDRKDSVFWYTPTSCLGNSFSIEKCGGEQKFPSRLIRFFLFQRTVSIEKVICQGTAFGCILEHYLLDQNAQWKRENAIWWSVISTTVIYFYITTYQMGMCVLHLTFSIAKLYAKSRAKT